MRVLKDWFWKYQVFFNKKIYSNVVEFSKHLESREKDIFLNELDFFMSFYTFQTLLDAIDKNAGNKEDIFLIIQKAKDNISKIVYVDNLLFEEHLKDINRYENYKHELISILNFAHKESKLNINIKEYLDIIVNDTELFFEFIKNQKTHPINYTQTFIDKSEIKPEFAKNYDKINSSENINQFFGKNKVGKFKFIVKDEDGYGEFWDSDIYDDYKENTLILKSNDGNLTYDDFVYTIIHEVYPGHGHFFNETKHKNIYYDSGALFLIEGYATVCELLINKRPNYVNHLKHKYLTIVNAVVSSNLDALKNDYIEHYKYIKKYPVYYESYYFGAFYLMYLLDSKQITNLKELFDKLKGNNIGNFMKIYF